MQNTPALKTKTVLPGLALLFLVQCYSSLIGLFFCYMTMEAIVAFESPDMIFTLWFFAIVALSALTITTTVGMHGRAVWAAKTAAALCKANIAFLLILLLFVLFLIADASGFGASDMDALSLLLSGLVIAMILLYAAWDRYFANSTRIKAVFGDNTPATRKLPPLSVGLLQTLCLFLLPLYLPGLIPSMDPPLPGGGSTLFSPYRMWIYGNVAFASLTLFSVTNRNRGATYAMLGLWSLLAALGANILSWMRVPGLMGGMYGRSGGDDIMAMLQGGSPFFLLAALVALWWRLDSTDDARWFEKAGGDDEEYRQTSRPINRAIPLFMVWVAVSVLTPGFTRIVSAIVYSMPERPFTITPVLLVHIGVVAAGVLLCAAAAVLWYRRNPASVRICVALGGLGIAYSLFTVWMIIRAITPSRLSLAAPGYILAMLIDIAILGLFVRYFIGLNRQCGRQYGQQEPKNADLDSGKVGMPLPLVAFQLFCLEVISRLMGVIIPQLAYWFEIADSSGLNRYDSNSAPGTSTIAVFLIAAFMIWAVRLRKGAALYCLIPFQIFMVLAAFCSALAGAALYSGGAAMSFGNMNALNALEMAIQPLIVFIGYLYCSPQSKQWLDPPQPEGHAPEREPGRQPDRKQDHEQGGASPAGV